MRRMRCFLLGTVLLISCMSFAGCNNTDNNSDTVNETTAETTAASEETTTVTTTEAAAVTEAVTQVETEPETEATTEEPEPEPEGLAYWQEMYLSHIESEREYENSDWNEYALVHIDDDDIPELIGSYSPIRYTLTKAEGLYTTNIMLDDMFVGYIPRTGILGMEAIIFDLSDTYFKEFKLDGTDLKIKAEMYATLDDGDYRYCTVDGNYVSKEEYDAACQKKRDDYTQPVYYSYEEMREILTSKYIPPQYEESDADAGEEDWREVYQWVVYDYENEWSEYYHDMEYALIYVDNNNIPELYMSSVSGQMRSLYTCYNNHALLLIDSQGRDHCFSPASIEEKLGKIWTVGSGGSTVWGYDCFTLYKGQLYQNESVTFDCYEDKYTINNEVVSEEEFRDKDKIYEELANMGSMDVIYYSYDEIMELF